MELQLPIRSWRTSEAVDKALLYSSCWIRVHQPSDFCIHSPRMMIFREDKTEKKYGKASFLEIFLKMNLQLVLESGNRISLKHNEKMHGIEGFLYSHLLTRWWEKKWNSLPLMLIYYGRKFKKKHLKQFQGFETQGWCWEFTHASDKKNMFCFGSDSATNTS